jgi:hypothetical protein
MRTANKQRRQKNPPSPTSLRARLRRVERLRRSGAEWEVDFVCILFGSWLGGQSTPTCAGAGWGEAKEEAAPVSGVAVELAVALQ